MRDKFSYVAGGGWGDYLMVASKCLWLRSRSVDFDVIYYSDQKKTVELGNKFSELNHIPMKAVYTDNLDRSLICALDERLPLTTVWNGDISNNSGQKKIFRSNGDMIPVKMANIDFTIQGDGIREGHKGRDFFVVQLRAGFGQHNERKNWLNMEKVYSFADKLREKTGYSCYFIGHTIPDMHVQMQKENTVWDVSDIIYCDHSNLESISYIEKAKFVVCLSGFTALCSLMFGRPTYYKFENVLIENHYYDNPRWNRVRNPIEELTEEVMKKIYDENRPIDL